MYSGTKQKDGHHTFRRFSCTVESSRKMVIIHLGGFHAFMGCFGVIGAYMSGIGFEEILYQFIMSQPGVMTRKL